MIPLRSPPSLFGFAARSGSEMPPAGAAVGSRPLLAVITPLTSVLLRASDAGSIAQQLLALELGSVLACNSFGSSEEAMCWLTDPDAIAAVTAGVIGQPSAAVSATVGSAAWLAVVGRGARACFEINTSGVGGAVQLMQTTASTLCVAASFSVATDAYLWLANDAGGAMQRLVATTAPASAPPAEKQALPAPLVRSPLEFESVPGPRAPSPLRWPSAAPAAVSPVHKRARVGRFTTPSAVVPSRPLTSSTLCASAVGRALAAPKPAPSPGLKRSCHLYGSADRGVSNATASAPSSSRGAWQSGVDRSPSPCPCGAVACLVGVPDNGAGGLRRSGGGRSFQSANVGGSGSRGCVKKGGPSDCKNPSWVGPGDPGQGQFTFQSIHRMVADSVSQWEQNDYEEALRRDAALGAQRQAAWASLDKAGGSLLAVATGLGDDRADGAPGADAVPGNDTCPPPRGADVVGGGSSNASLPPSPGPLTRMAADCSWTAVFQRLFDRGLSTFVSGGPGVGKTSFLRSFHGFVRRRLPGTGAVVVVAPTGSAAKTAKGVTYHSFFGFTKDYKMQSDNPIQEAARLLALDRWRPIARRLAKVEVLMIDEISMVPADNFDVMHELLQQSRGGKPPAVIYTFGDFLQLSPPFGKMAFTGHCWPLMFGDGFVELTRVHRQGQPDFVAAIHDARFGRCTDAVQALMDERSVSDEAYDTLQYQALHIMPRHEDVDNHNQACLRRLCAGSPPTVSIAIHDVKEDPNRDRDVASPNLGNVSVQARDAALIDCVAPRRVEHCRGARVMLTSNHFLGLGLFHGSIGHLVDYETDGTPVVRFDDHELTEGTRSGRQGVRGAGADWLEVCCPPVEFESRILSRPGAVAVRVQVPFVLGWGITVHRSQSLTLSEAVLDIGEAFGSGMVLAAMSRVPDKRRMHVRSFCGSRVMADADALQLYRDSPRL